MSDLVERIERIEQLRAALQIVVDLAEDGILPDGGQLADLRVLIKGFAQ